MDLPFTAEVLDSVLARYNAAIWPVQLFVVALAIAAVALVLRPLPGGSRAVAALLAAAWAWVGYAFHIREAAVIDFAAPAYGVGFLLQAALLAWSGAIRGSLDFRFRPNAEDWVGLTVVLFSILGYPLLTVLIGGPSASTPLVGTAPDPTAMLTLGFLLLTGGPPLHLVILPMLWSIVAGMTAMVLDTPERHALSVTAVLVMTIIGFRLFRRPG